MNTNKSVSGVFCTKCADVNGDLKVTPADAQLAFDIYLGKIANPTWCELENADVKCDGTKLSPKVSPADAQMIFNRYLKKGVADSTCSGESRAATASTLAWSSPLVSLTINTTAFVPGRDVHVPVIIDSPSEINAFGFDLAFPSDTLTFVGLETTDLTTDYEQVEANVVPYPQTLNFQSDSPQSIQDLGHKPRPIGQIYRLLRVGGYKTKSRHQSFLRSLGHLDIQSDR